MIDGLKPYPKMKDSGVLWLGAVPEHWEVLRLRNLADCAFSGIDKEVRPEEVPVRFVGTDTVYSTSSILSSTPLIRVTASRSEVRRFRLVKGDVLITKDSVVPTRIAVPALVRDDPTELTVCGYHLGTIRARVGVQSGYLFWALQSIQYSDYFVAEARGTTIIGLPLVAVASAPFLRPPPGEQTAIVRFLDHADRRIRRYIRAKQKLIKLLEEQKQAIIYRAVTRGLDPNVGLKRSGVEWLGDVPEHWELVPNRAVMRLQKRLVGKASSEFTLLSLTKRGVIQRDMENPEGKFPTSFDTYQEVLPGDLVFCLFDIDETPRAVGLSTLHGMITGAYTRFTCDPSLVEWVYLFYLAMDSGKRLKPLYTGLRKVITKSSFLSAKLPLPPERERSQILSAVEKTVRTADEGVEKANREILLLREYSTRLIADIVTGKLDVREAAARLPDEIEEHEPPDETEALGDASEDAGDGLDPEPEEAEA